MTIVRAVVGAAVIAFCAGFIPVGGCAKGCAGAGKVASHTDDFARVGVRGAGYSDDLARGATRYGDDLASAQRYRGGMVVGGGVTHGGEDVAMHLSKSNLETAVATLPEGEGAITAIARRPTPSGARLDGLDDAGRNFSKDYAKSVDDLALSEKQHEELMDAFGTAQDIAEPVIEALDGGDEEDETQRLIASARAREKLQLVALELEASVASTLTPEQLRKFRAQFGSSEVVAYRLGKDRPIARKGTDTRTGNDRPTARKNDKVAP